jgi:hypothetical protein
MLKAFVKYLLQEFYGMFNLCWNPIITNNIYPCYLSSKITCKKLITIHNSYRKYHVLTHLIYNSFSMKFIFHSILWIFLLVLTIFKYNYLWKIIDDYFSNNEPLNSHHNEQKNTYFAFNRITHISKHENSHNVSIDLLCHWTTSHEHFKTTKLIEAKF